MHQVKCLAKVEKHSTWHLTIVESWEPGISTGNRSLTKMSTSEARLEGMEKMVCF